MSMMVSHLQRHLESLAAWLKDSGGATVAKDLAEIQIGLAPFADKPLKAFADFLVKAEGYYSRGEVALPSKAGRARTSAAPRPRAPKLDAGTLAGEARELYDQAATPQVTTEMINSLMVRLGKLTIEQLADVVGEKLGIRDLKSKKPKAKMVEAIGTFIAARKGGSQCAALTEPAKPQILPPPNGDSKPAQPDAPVPIGNSPHV